MKWLFIALALLSCERSRTKAPPVITTKVYKIYLFAANYCHPCREELPEIDEWWRMMPEEKKERITPTIHLVAGTTPSSFPTLDNCNQLKQELKLSMPCTTDKYSKTYKKFYGAPGSIPATVITDGNGAIVKMFYPGKVTIRELEEWIK